MDVTSYAMESEGLISNTGDARAEPGRRGEPADLGAVFDANAAALYRTILAFTGGRTDIAEDAVAEAFARAAARSETLRDPAAWLYRVAFNVATDELRRERHRTDREVPELTVVPPDVIGVLDALRRLPPRERAAVVLRYVLDLSVSEVAARMGVASPTVRVHLMRARRRLRDELGDDEVSG